MNDFFEAHHAHKQTYTERPVYHDTYHYHEHDSRDEQFDYYYHQHKPEERPQIKVQSDWTCTDTESPEFIKNKGVLGTLSEADINNLVNVCEKYPEQEEKIKRILEKAHTHDNKTTLDKITEQNIAQFHTHKNLSVLETLNEDKLNLLYQITQCDIDKWNEVADKSRNITHKNQDVLDKLTLDVINLAHSHDNIKVLDSITEKHVHLHENLDVLNNIDFTTILNWNEAYNKSHEHENKGALNQITCESVKLWDEASKYFTLEGDTLCTEYKLDIPSIIEVVDNLESTDADRALSANQGRKLKQMIDTFEWEEL